MPVRKNPDWYVWASDVWYWARQSPQVFVLLTLAICAALFFIYLKPTTQTAVYQPQYIPASQPAYTPPQQPAPQPVSPKVAISSAASTSPLKDRCPVDFIFIDSRNDCFALVSGHWYILAEGNTMRLSQRFAMRVTFGRAEVSSNGQNIVVNPVPDSYPPTRVNGGTITALVTQTRVGIQFPIP